MQERGHRPPIQQDQTGLHTVIPINYVTEIGVPKNSL